MLANTWVHLAVTYNGSALILYVNGSQAATRAITGSIVTSSQALRIGGSALWGEYFAGRIDEVRIYNRALTASEIQTDMNTAVGPAAPPPDFSVSAAPGTRSVIQGSSTTYTVTTSALNGFAGPVALSASGLPGNATASFNPATLTGAGSSTLTITTAANTPTGSPTLTITGTSGSLTRTASVGLVVNAAPSPDFTLAVAPGSRTVTQGGAASYTVTMTAVNGFAGTVNLSAGGLPSNATASFSPSSIAGTQTSTLTVTTAASTPAGSSTVAVSGTDGTLSRSATADLVVAPASPGRAIGIDFVGTGTAMAASESAGVLPQANWNTATGASRTAALPLLDETGAASGATVTWASAGTWAIPITDQAGTRRLMKGYLDTTDTSVTTITVAGLPNAAYDVYVYSDGDNDTSARTGAYRISGAGITATTINATDAASTNFNAAFTQAAGSSGNYVKFSVVAGGFTLTATPVGTSGTRRAPLNAVQIVPASQPAPPAPDFSLSSTPSSRTLTQGASTSYTATVTALNGFAGNVDLTVSGLPADTTAAFTPASVGGAGNATLNVTTSSGTPAGSSTLTITGTSGTLTHTSTVTLVVNAAPVPDFTLSATPASRSATQGSATAYSVTVTAVNGFTGPVGLSAVGLPSNASAAFTPASISGSGTSTLDVLVGGNTPAGTSTITLTGASGTLSHSTSVSLTVAPLTHSISGVITPSGSASGVSVSLGGSASATTTTDAAGNYAFAGLQDGSYLITPTKSGFTFSPANRTVTLSGADAAGVDFAAMPSANTISLTAPANGATVSSAFSMSATGSASVVAVQFLIDDVRVGPEDTTAPYAVAVTAAGGSHRLNAIGRDASGNTVTSATVTVTVTSGSGTTLTINGSQTFQTMDGFGVNLNSLSWKNGELAPALDRLADELGVKTWRVVFDMGDWESTNDNTDPNTPNWAYYNALYSNAKFQNLWGTLHYLNQKGITSGSRSVSWAVSAVDGGRPSPRRRPTKPSGSRQWPRSSTTQEIPRTSSSTCSTRSTKPTMTGSRVRGSASGSTRGCCRSSRLSWMRWASRT